MIIKDLSNIYMYVYICEVAEIAKSLAKIAKSLAIFKWFCPLFISQVEPNMPSELMYTIFGHAKSI